MVYPGHGPASIREIWNLDDRKRHRDRPWVIMCMIASVDGAITVDGTAAGLGSATDKQLFLHLHTEADAVLVGASTVRAERYRPLPANQKLVIFSRTGDLGSVTDTLVSAKNTVIINGDVGIALPQLDVNVCVLEGGPNLNGQMLAANLVDEVSLTIAPRLLSSPALRAASGALADSRLWILETVCEGDDGFLFLQYRRTR